MIEKYGSILNNHEERLSVRFRALFRQGCLLLCLEYFGSKKNIRIKSLKNLGGNAAIDEIGKCFNDSSELLKHELAYCLGQMKSEYALKVLMGVLKDYNQVRVLIF